MKVRTFLLFIVSFTLLLSGCTAIPLWEISVDPTEKPTPEPTEPPRGGIDTSDVTYLTDVGEAREAIESENLLLVNKTHALGEAYQPNDLVTLSDSLCTKANIQLNAAAAQALRAMIAEAKAAGVTSLLVTSGYRSFAYQNQLFAYYCNLEKQNNPKLSQAEVEKTVLTYSARPGESEHQSGLCVDLFTSAMTGLYNYGNETAAEGDLGFAETDAYAWLRENAWKFGFIERYPEGKDAVTGYAYESWHYRFVGIRAASVIHDEGITLEEFIDRIE